MSIKIFWFVIVLLVAFFVSLFFLKGKDVSPADPTPTVEVVKQRTSPAVVYPCDDMVEKCS
jgi:hypothetical protein